MQALRGVSRGLVSGRSSIRAAQAIAPVFGNNQQQVRNFGVGHGDYGYHVWWARFWKVTTYTGIFCIIGYAYYLFFVMDHPEYEYSPPYPYRRVRRKPFPWGDCNLFDKPCWDALREHLKKEEAAKAEAA
eukprot:TRINITY_DN6967_c0_g1_i3.p2 TRINITY_DN6967_c0_g1~~TRINITY_DN6967_c0_g1_i3.p2  ORF type:complete len:130 (+),score=16.63 TRINITY_DN6967_c0_g1_i3:75-464(+)